jgi:hypothetical protein
VSVAIAPSSNTTAPAPRQKDADANHPSFSGFAAVKLV